jgi:hypothetical protein
MTSKAVFINIHPIGPCDFLEIQKNAPECKCLGLYKEDSATKLEDATTVHVESSNGFLELGTWNRTTSYKRAGAHFNGFNSWKSLKIGGCRVAKF